MMQFPRTQVNAAANDVRRHAELEVIENGDNILVIADSSQAINEFELRVAIQGSVWEGPTCLDATGMVNTLTDIQGERTEFRPRHSNNEWQARYSISIR